MNDSSSYFLTNALSVPVESWFIPVGVVTALCLALATFLAGIFFLIIVVDKTCHTIPMMLVGNSCLIAVIFGIDQLYTRAFTLDNDLKRVAYRDLLCNFRGYMGYATCSIQNSSYLLQAVHRYVTIVYPTRFVLQSIRFQIVVIILTWLIGFLYPIAFLFTGEILHNIDNQICQLPLRLSFSVIYMAHGAYIVPVLLTILVYVKLIRHVKSISLRVTPANTLSRARRELKMVRRIVIVVSIIFIACFPYAMFIFFSFFLTIPKYHFRISYVFIDVSFLAVVLVVFQFTDSLRMSLMRKVDRRPMTIMPTIAHGI